jgi:cell wall-associated NlpC family hydrolase
VTLGSVSLFGGAVIATSVAATDGHGAVTGLEVDGTAVSAAPGQTVPVADWGQLTLGATVGRLTAPLVLRLLQARDSLPAGTSILLAFAATAQPVSGPKAKHHSSQTPHQADRTHARSHRHAKHASGNEKRRQQPAKPPPDFPAIPDPLLPGGTLGPAVQHNAVVSTAMQYLGVPYKWGGASPETGFDCSGLVTYVFAKIGVALPHFAAAQWYSPAAVWVRPSRLEAGDLVFFTGSDGTRKMPGHVGIYVGDGYLIDAPHTGSFVRIDSLDDRWFANNFVGATRIVGANSRAARHLAHATKQTAAATAIPRSLLPISLEPVSDSTGVAAAAAAIRPASRNYGLWVGAPSGGLLLVLLAGGAVVLHRRRHSPVATPGN